MGTKEDPLCPSGKRDCYEHDDAVIQEGCRHDAGTGERRTFSVPGDRTSMYVNAKAAGVAFAVAVLLMSMAVPARAVSNDDREALIELYLATQGDGWYENSGWRDEPLDSDGFAMRSMVCSWYGIMCDWLRRDVLYVYLAQNNLDGDIDCLNDLSKGALEDLFILDLSGNRIQGGIPEGLGDFEELDSLFLNDNLFSGRIPAELGSLGLHNLNLRGNMLTGPVPDELGDLEDLDSDSLDLRWNALYTTDAELREFLDSRQIGGNWESTQTVAPQNPRTGQVKMNSIEVFWDTIPYRDDEGVYEVYRSITSGGPFVPVAVTDDKAAGSVEVTGLDPGTTYYFRVRTITFSHQYNKNDVSSDFSDEISGTTLGGDLPGLSVGNVTVGEYEPQALFRVTVSPVSVLDISFSYATSSGTATADSDYVHAQGLALIPAGQESLDLEVDLIDDDEAEDEETFFMVLSEPMNAMLVVATGVASIVDDENTIQGEEQGDDDEPDNVCFISTAGGIIRPDVRSGSLLRCR
ncbi:MAG: fibronectin type III domain-containing protein [Deltaproteobacteria bacterium]|nr:fibronectin type III domain-containing protein [Deltaproteobacteria bacterium]